MEDLRGIVTTRNLAIYDDKIYLTTFDAHVVALNARTGDLVWNIEGLEAQPGSYFIHHSGNIGN